MPFAVVQELVEISELLRTSQLFGLAGEVVPVGYGRTRRCSGPIRQTPTNLRTPPSP